MAPGAPGLDRDRFVDLLRGGSIVAVVLGHWLVADVRWAGSPGAGSLTETSALAEVPAMWPITWLLVVIPLFFFVGGYANRRSWEGSVRRAEGYATFVDRRVHRILAPTGLYLAVVIPVGLIVDLAGGLGLRAMGGLFLQPLWFLGVYLVVVALVPVTLALHRRFGPAVPVALLGLVALADVGRFAGGIEVGGYLNVLLVWLLMHQLGYFYSDRRPDRRVALAMLVGGLAATSLLVGLGPYSATMVGVPDGPVGNMHPPTLAITALGFAQVGGALLLRDVLLRWLARPHVWAAVIAVNLSVVTIYLWHQAALTLAARVVQPWGLPDPVPGTAAWWAARLLWLVFPGVVLAGIVALVGRAERVTAPPPIVADRLSTVVAVVTMVVIGLGFLAVAGSSATEPRAAGQSMGPFTASVPLGVGLLLCAWASFRLLRSRTPGRGGVGARRRLSAGR
jgi:Acyltransferase family